MKNQVKKSYQTPSLTVHGDALQLTQATSSGTKYDRDFNTPIHIGDPIQMS